MLMLAMERSRSATRSSGGDCGGETPVPIPNTAVKPARADGTWGETPWESRSPPVLSKMTPAHRGGRHRVSEQANRHRPVALRPPTTGTAVEDPPRKPRRDGERPKRTG